MTPLKKRILIVEDDEFLRNSFNIIITSSGKYKVIGCYGNVPDAMKHIKRDMPDVVLMDIELPEINGVEGVKLIKQHFPHIDVVMISVYNDSSIVFDSLRAGACGYIAKGTNYIELIDALDELVSGGSPMSSQIARMVVNHFHVSYHSPLSDRERQILELLSKGKNYSEIADLLSISKETSKTHIRNIYTKLNVHSKSGALEKAREDKLII
jgi:DNA-binding NarL/FixJ family response regulator